jgi:hypothetical protein
MLNPTPVVRLLMYSYAQLQWLLLLAMQLIGMVKDGSRARGPYPPLYRQRG